MNRQLFSMQLSIYLWLIGLYTLLETKRENVLVWAWLGLEVVKPNAWITEL
jgi:hypothetical protein